MKKILITLLVLGAAGLIAASHFARTVDAPNIESENTAQTESAESTPTPQGPPTFSWEYEPYETPYIPHTIISLTATYPDGTRVTKVIEDIEGGCNVFTEPDADVYENSTMIMCYYAGFGRYYKVIANGQGYSVERKEFEEASPDYNPPQPGYQSIVTF